MTVKGLIIKGFNLLGRGIRSLINLVLNAKAENILKASLFIGGILITFVLYMKALRDKQKMYRDNSRKSVVDDALGLNYADCENHEHLNPLLKKIKKSFNGKKRKKKSHKNARDIFNQSTLKAERRDIREHGPKFGPSILKALHIFENDFDAINKDDIRRSRRPDNYSVKRAWDAL